MKETIQKRLSDSKTARWTALFIVSFTMMCGYFLTDVMSPLENLLTTKGQVVYFTDDTSMPADSLVAKVNYFSSEEMLSNPLLTVEQLEEGRKGIPFNQSSHKHQSRRHHSGKTDSHFIQNHPTEKQHQQEHINQAISP